MGHGTRAAPLHRLMGRGTRAAPLHRLMGMAPEPLPSTITSGSAAAGPLSSIHRSSAGMPCKSGGPTGLHRPHRLTSLHVEREGSLHGPVGVCQRILVLQDIPIHVSGYLVVVVITACLLSSITRLLRP